MWLGLRGRLRLGRRHGLRWHCDGWADGLAWRDGGLGGGLGCRCRLRHLSRRLGPNRLGRPRLGPGRDRLVPRSPGAAAPLVHQRRLGRLPFRGRLRGRLFLGLGLCRSLTPLEGIEPGLEGPELSLGWELTDVVVESGCVSAQLIGLALRLRRLSARFRGDDDGHYGHGDDHEPEHRCHEPHGYDPQFELAQQLMLEHSRIASAGGGARTPNLDGKRSRFCRTMLRKKCIWVG